MKLLRAIEVVNQYRGHSAGTYALVFKATGDDDHRYERYRWGTAYCSCIASGSGILPGSARSM